MMRKQETRGISKDAGADICLGFNGQQVQGTGDKARTLEGNSIIVQSRKSAPALQREKMIKESHAYFIFGRKERKETKKSSLRIPNHRPIFRQVWGLNLQECLA